MSTSYTVIIETPGDGESWSAFTPDLCVYATADTRDAVVAQITDAIQFHLLALHKDGLPVPAASTSVIQVVAARLHEAHRATPHLPT